MADNVAYTPGSGATIAADEIGGVLHQRVKLSLGADGSAADAPGDGTDGMLVNLGANNDVTVAGVATAANQTTLIGHVDGIETVLGTIDADTSALAGTVAGTEVQVDIVAALPAGTNNIGDVDVLTLPNVTIGTMAALVAGTANIGDVDVLSFPAAQIGSNTGVKVEGCTAHDGIDAGGPVKIGMRAIAHGTNPTAVAAADRTDWLANRAGIPWVMGGHPNIVTIEVATTGAQTDVAIVTISTGLKIVVTQVQVVTDNANTAFPQVRVGFGTANTPTTTGVVLTHPGLPAGGGVSRGDGSGIIGIGADNEDLRYTCAAPTGGSLRVLVSYYTIET